MVHAAAGTVGWCWIWGWCICRGSGWSQRVCWCDSGTFDGLACNTTSTFRLNDRWDFKAYADNADRVSQFNFVIPSEFIPSRSIRVSVKWTLNALLFGSTNVNWKVGLTPCVPSYQAGEPQAVYVNTSAIINGWNFYPNFTSQFDFSDPGVWFIPGRPISISIIRDNSDGFTGTVYVSHAEIIMI